MERSLYWYIGSLHILTNTYTTALTTEKVTKKVLLPPCLIEHIPLSQIKMTCIMNTEQASENIFTYSSFLSHNLITGTNRHPLKNY